MPLNPGNSAYASDAIPNMGDERKSLPLYHGTTSGAAKIAQKEGLLHPRSGDNYVTTSKQYARYHAKNFSYPEHHPGDDAPVVLHIDRRHPALKGLERDEEFGLEKGRPHSFRTRNRIPPEAIKKVEPVKGNPRYNHKTRPPAAFQKENRAAYGDFTPVSPKTYHDSTESE